MHQIIFLLALFIGGASVCAETPSETVRVATFNVSLYGEFEGDIANRLASGSDAQANDIVRVIQTVRPDILLVNELDHDADGAAGDALIKMLAAGEAPIEYPFSLALESNTGASSGLDLDGDGNLGGPADAFGFGRYPGQYAFAIFSRFPILESKVRSFAKFRWMDFPGATPPTSPDGSPYYDQQTWQSLRLSSKSHADVPIAIGDAALHVLASHPTPPVFDGPEDRNGLRNRDEILFWKHYLNNHEALIDDSGIKGGLPKSASFVIAGDLNSDPNAGDSIRSAITSLIGDARVQDVVPSHDGNASTALFSRRQVRVDYVLPSADLRIRQSGVFWPSDGEPARWIRASDHRLVWVDIETATIERTR